jgi:parvulin-like peptidyl-prolyl isomerase
VAEDRKQRRGRAAERERADQQVRLIYIGSGAVLVIAALAVVVGLFVTRYQPPRAHVLTVDGESHQARDVVDRGAYLAFFEGGASSINDIAQSTVDMLVEEAALRSQAAQLVGPVTEADIEHELFIEFDLIVEEPLIVVTDDDEDADATATPEPTATPEVDPQEFAEALTDFLRNSDLDRGTFELIVEARLYRERLQERFEADVGEAGPQLSLQRIRMSTQLAADSVIEDLAGGADFATLAVEQSVAEGDGEGGDIGWTTLELLDEDVRLAVGGLGAGEYSPVIAAGVFFEVYRVAEVAEDREYEALVASQLATLRFDEWMETAIATIEVERDLSADEESWINERVLAAVSARLGS